jgi:Fe-S-cluster containining protein
MMELWFQVHFFEFKVKPIIAFMQKQRTLDQRPYFFDAGIYFACRRCGDCCVGDPGTIYVSEGEVNALAQHFKINSSDFIRRYLYPFKDSYSIREDDRGRCLFFDNGCSIYSLRPCQCRTFPFWFENLRSENRWQKVAHQCPGIGSGRLYSCEENLSIVQTTPTI